ncbi:Calcium channel YVC1 [Cytospora mali]|uniref:Calcium channel YVC1 n=1 Tax=Cytospora mali TaxID=578113 RepID=A0A194UZ01_CYTMA|nr:Calcium channel YVC1 [Valsa mali var. pyri (nom. inval.)]
MANCLQFQKEGQLNPGNAGTSSTRSKVCELLAIKLLKEYTTRELIDALSYDFYPLQGIPGTQTPMTPGDGKPKQAAARTSTLEVAIRASAKHFLAHPLVVQQLEAIWNGAISFYSSADNLHRQNSRESIASARGRSPQRRSNARTPLLRFQKGAEPQQTFSTSPLIARRTVALYDPRNASILKLSRLRVPRYRQFFSTCSLAILICLFLSVLIERSDRITSLELLFWFWSAGFMLDELVGFTEQGFSLYIMSFWNIFDLGILVLLIIYYCMRIYTVFLVDSHTGVDAYDVLAANAVLLLPRIFSVLDHYPYFSQILLAMRIMSVDLAAVFVLIFISCSGFFVFFLANTKSDAGEVAYKIFQILMGFTPAAWDVWPSYTWLDRTLMVLFLIICHFVVVTILITVLTNSFMSIASNATEEHQFLFAINTIAMVKDQSLFSYVAPGNIFAWVLMPLRYFMPLRHFVWLNRTIIKITHFPLLFCIFMYEKYILSPSMFEPTDFVDNPGLGRGRAFSINPSGRSALFSPTIRIREESVAGFQQDRALEEVFRRTPASLRAHKMDERKRTQNAIRNWMDQNEAIPESPNNYSTIDSRAQQEWGRKFSLGKERPPRRSRHLSEVRSIASDPAELVSNSGFAMDGAFGGIDRRDHAERTILKDQDADDELVTNDEDEDEATAPSHLSRSRSRTEEEEDYFTTPVATRFNNPLMSTSLGSSIRSPAQKPGPLAKRLGMHSRTLSTNTILYNPPKSGRLPPRDDEISSPGPVMKTRSRPISTRQTPAGSPIHRSPRRNINFGSRPRPIMPPRENTHTAPNISRFGPGLSIDQPSRRPPKTRRMSSSDLLDIQSDLGGMDADDTFGAVPSSFVTQMAMATGMIAPGGHRGHDKVQRERDNDRDRMGRLVLARMKTLEEGFADVVKEMKTLQRTSGVSTTTHSSASEGTGSAVWKGGDGDRLKPFTTIEVAGQDRGAGGARGGKTYKADSSTKASGSRPQSRRGGNKSNRNSVILRSPIGLVGNGGVKGKGKGKGVETRRAEESESEADESGEDGDVDPVGASFSKGSSL